MRDLRMPALAGATWSGGLCWWGAGPKSWPLVVLVAVVALGCALRLPVSWRATLVGAAVLFAGCWGTAALHTSAVAHNPVAEFAEAGTVATLRGTVVSDPVLVRTAHADLDRLRLQVRTLTARGSSYTLRTPVLVLGHTSWARVRLGESVSATGRLRASDGPDDIAAVFLADTDPVSVAAPGPWWRASARVRAAVRASVARRPAEEAALIPALVDGDVTSIDETTADRFRIAGLTHLMAVSGTNLTLVLGFLLTIGRWGGVRGRWLIVVGALGVAGFVLLARTEPSVLRAAVMGTIGMISLQSRARGLRTLGGAVVALLLVDPPLAISVGFALSTLATCGILWFAPAWRDALARWMPRWLAEAIAVPAAAQWACTPLVAAISGQVSLVAIGANLLAEPAVGPATVLGLCAGLVGVAWPWCGRVVGYPASLLAGWILLVARRGAALPGAAIGWGTGAWALVALTAACALIVVYAPRVLSNRWAGASSCLALVAVVCLRVPVLGWPPSGWVLVACDVGQGDGLVLNAGGGAAVVVDAGPDPAPMARCLDRLRITSVPLFVLTHFHADHVDGVRAVFDGRRVGQVWTTRLQDPPEGVSELNAAARAAGVVPAPVPYGATVSIGPVQLQVLWPPADSPTIGPGDGSTANESSVVLLAREAGITMLLTGDVEPEGQEQLARVLDGLRVDVLKVPHHGSRYQDEDWLVSLRPRITIASVGADNDYGHPATSTLSPLSQAGAEVYRTDQDGSIAVVDTAQGPGVRTR